MDILVRGIRKEAADELNKLAKHFGTTRNQILVEIIEEHAQESKQNFATHDLTNQLDDVRLSLDKLTEAENKSKAVNTEELQEIKQVLQMVLNKL